MRRRLLAIHRRLLERQGPSGWWPGRTAFEVCVGAVLTQNTAWTNVERALGSLRRAGRLSFRGLRGLPPRRIEPLVRASGTFRVKARRLHAFVAFLEREYGGRVSGMEREQPWSLRRKLLAVPGIGPETADAIALYAARKPLFVVDAYTRRIAFRLGLAREDASYADLQALFMRHLPEDVALYNEYHAQWVRLAKDTCRPRPRCGACALDDLCPKRGVPRSES